MFSTPDLCDAFPERVEVVEPLFTNYGAKEIFMGEIVTVKCHEDNTYVKEQLNSPGEGKVLIVDGGGSVRCALMGDMIAESAIENGWEGVIINGGIRDVDIIMTLELGVQALATIPLKSDRRGAGIFNEVVSFGGACFKPGSFVYADNNGIIVSSQSLIP